MVAEGKGKCYTSYDDVVSFVGRFQGFMVPVFVPIDNTELWMTSPRSILHNCPRCWPLGSGPRGSGINQELRIAFFLQASVIAHAKQQQQQLVSQVSLTHQVTPSFSPPHLLLQFRFNQPPKDQFFLHALFSDTGAIFKFDSSNFFSQPNFTKSLPNKKQITQFPNNT